MLCRSLHSLMKFIKKFRGVRRGEIYPHVFKPGDDCPNELLQAAIEQGAVDPMSVSRPLGGPTGEIAPVSSSRAGRQRSKRQSSMRKAEPTS